MTSLMTLHEMADRTGHNLDALRQRKKRGVLGIEPVALIGQTHVYDETEAETWIKTNAKEDQ